MFLLGAVMVIWCLLLAWIARTAQGRGRSVIGWTACAAVAGALGLLGGITVLASVMAQNEFSLSHGGNSDLTLLAVLLPPALLVAPMIGIGVVLHRVPVKVSNRTSWAVHFMDRGPGRIWFDGGAACFEWSAGSRRVPGDQVRTVAADGECVRVTCIIDDDKTLELVAMPMGKPETPAGRRQQSVLLADQLRSVGRAG